ncbi:MAG: MFS transporter [Saprospiraceae bacterium]|nr:MFS transporter [Saprospiraceae bacterium]
MHDKFSPYQRFVIALLALTQFTVVLDFMVMSPMGDILIKALDITPAQFGAAVSAYAFSAGISGLLAAGFADKYDRKRLLLFFYTGFILGTVFCGLAPNYPALVAARIFTGVFGGVISSIAMAIVADLFHISQRGRVMGIVQTGFAASQVLGIPIGLIIATHWGWHFTFLLIAGLGLAISIVMLQWMRPVDLHLKLQTEHNAVQHLLKTFSVKTYRQAFMTTALLGIGGFLLMPFGSAFLVNNVGISQEQLPLVFMSTGIFSLVAMPVMGKLSDKVDKFRLFTIGSLWAVIWMLVYTSLPVVPLWAVILVNILLFVGIMSRMVPAMAIMSSVPVMADRGAFMSINTSLQQIAGGIAASFAGLIVVQADKNSPIEHYPVLGVVGAVIVLICIWLMNRIRNSRRQIEAVEKMPEPQAAEPALLENS